MADSPYDALLAELAAQGVHTLLVQFTDLDGVAKGKWLPLHQLPVAVQDGAGFAGPSITGTGLPRCGPRSEFYARADLGTLSVLPWMRARGTLAGNGPEGMKPRMRLSNTTSLTVWPASLQLRPRSVLRPRSGCSVGDPKPG